MPGDAKVLIAGAGIGGLTAALALLGRGFDVEVLEQAEELREIGAGLQIAANGTRVLIGLGLEEALSRVAVVPVGKEVRLWNTSRTWKLFDLGEDSIRRFGAPYWMVHRGDLHRVLLDAVESARPGAVVRGARVVGVRDAGGRPVLDLADGRVVEGDIVIGADGIHSAVRRTLFGEDRPVFTGLLAWRGVVPTADLPADLTRLVGTNWIGPGGHVVTYPLRSGRLLNFVGLVERDDWRAESWTDPGTREECAADFPGWHPLVHAIIERIPTPYKWALLGREPLPRWSEGSISLLGDAAHPTLPALAQGANMAIEDGVVLARCLAESADGPTALRRYEAARLDRTAAIVRGSADNMRRFHNPLLADPVEGAAYIDREWQPERVRTRYDWLFEYDAWTVPI